MLLIENAHVVDSASGTDGRGALLVANGVVQDLVTGNAPGVPEGAERIDARGKHLFPGLIDMRVFTGEPGREYRETLMSAGHAAEAGGVTSFVAMPDTHPAVDDGSLVEFVRRRAAEDCAVNVVPSAAITKGLGGTEITEFGLLKEAGARCLTDGRRAIPSSGVLRAAFTYAANFDLPVLHLPLDAGLMGGGVMNEGLFATTLGLDGIPLEAETVALARDLEIAGLAGVRYHAAQLSCGRSVGMLEQAKAGNGAVSAGVSINNLALNEIDVGSYRTFFKVLPPLRGEDERLALVEGVKAGVIDCIHSDHDPQDVEGKRQPFAEAAVGAIGLETLFAAALRLYHEGGVPLSRLIAAMSLRPAEILGLEAGRLTKGAPADFILADLDYPWVFKEADIRSRSHNTTFEGARFTGKVMATYVRGRPVFEHQAGE